MGKISKNQRLLKALTLVELIIIVAIILILVLFTYTQIKQGSTAQARDVKRVSELNNLRTALQLYYMDFGEYPTSTENEEWCSVEGAGGERPECTTLIEKLAPYLAEIPEDPLFGEEKEPEEILYSYQYISTSSGAGYKLHTDLETEEPYEIGSWIGRIIAYAPPDGGGPGPGVSKFVKAVGGTDYEHGKSVQQTSDGGYIVAGYTQSYGAGEADLFLVKFDSVGQVTWAETVGTSTTWGQSRSVKQASDGGYILAGDTGNYGAVLVKLDSDGNLGGPGTWAKKVGGVNDWGNSIATTSEGGYVVTGWTNSCGAGGADLVLVKFDSDGNLGGPGTWAKTVGGTSSDQGSSVQQTSDGGYIVTGQTQSYGVGVYDLFLVKFYSDGEVEWAKAVGGAQSDHGKSVQQTSDGGYIVTGYTRSDGAGTIDLFLVKFDSDGNLGGPGTWAKTVGHLKSEYGESVATTTDGGYIVAGHTNSYGPIGENVFLVKFYSDGEVEWAKTVGGAENDYGYSVQETLGGGYIVTGYTLSDGAGLSDLILIKLDSEGNTCALQQSHSVTAVPTSVITIESVTVTAEPAPLTAEPVSLTVEPASPGTEDLCIP